MPTITATTTTWRAKSGRQVIRIVRLDGEYGRGHCFPTIILRLAGRTGCRLLAPVERQEQRVSEWKSAKAALYHSLDRDWTIVGETSLQAEDEPTLRKGLGSQGAKLIGLDAYEFLASWYPVVVSKRVSRTHDGLEIRRIVHVTNRNRAAVTITATKRSGYLECFDATWGGPRPASQSGTFHEKLHGERLVSLGEETRVRCPDEVTLRACLGPALLGWMSRGDYARLVRGGGDVGTKSSEVWGDGYDHGGTGLPPPPPAGAADTLSPTVPTPAPCSSTSAPRLRPVNAPAGTSAVEDADDPAYRDDPSYGSF